MPTKAYRKFEQRVDAYSEDLELCDMLIGRFRHGANTDQSISVSLGSTAARHPTLSRRGNSTRSRNIVGTHLKRTLHIAFIKDIHEDFSAYLAEVLYRAAQKGIDPARFIGEVKLDITVKDILNTRGWEAAVRLISEHVFRKLENERNTRALIQKIMDRLAVGIDQQIFTDAMPYLDARHMLVHQDGKADANFMRDYPGVRLRDGKIVTDYAFVSAAKTNIIALAGNIDAAMIAANLIRQQDLAGQREA